MNARKLVHTYRDHPNGLISIARLPEREQGAKQMWTESDQDRAELKHWALFYQPKCCWLFHQNSRERETVFVMLWCVFWHLWMFECLHHISAMSFTRLWCLSALVHCHLLVVTPSLSLCLLCLGTLTSGQQSAFALEELIIKPITLNAECWMHTHTHTSVWDWTFQYDKQQERGTGMKG